MQLKDNNNEKDQIMIDQDQPDADYIKMFVGQVPRSMDEGKVHKHKMLALDIFF